MIFPHFWNLVAQRKASAANGQGLTGYEGITPDLPNLERAIHDPKVQALVKESVESITTLQKEARSENERDVASDIIRKAILMDIQSYGARLAQAVDDNNLKEAAVHAGKLAELMDACGGGTCCPVHEPYLLRFLDLVAEAKTTLASDT